MDQLDIVPLRSLVAVADEGGFLRAATVLHLSQAGVSQHVRRLEAAVGRPLVERHGRGSRLTADGERLVAHGRRILALHDETLDDMRSPAVRDIVIGSTEHAAADLLPSLSAALARAAHPASFRFRLARGSRLRDDLRSGAIDLALLLDVTDDPTAVHVGDLPLTWFAAPEWRRHEGEPVPVVAFDEPCALRRRALATLAEHDVPAVVGAEATQLAGVQAAVGAGLGVALMATLALAPAGLVARDDLPVPRPLALSVVPSRTSSPDVLALVAQTVQAVLDEHRLVAAR